MLEAYQLGAVDFLMKPIQPQMLCAKASVFVELERRTDQVRRQADQIQAITDPIAERVRKVGGTTLRSIGSIARLQRVPDNDADYVDPLDMLAELRSDNQALIASSEKPNPEKPRTIAARKMQRIA